MIMEPSVRNRCFYCLDSPVRVKQMQMRDEQLEALGMPPRSVDVCEACDFPFHGDPPMFVAVVGAVGAGKSCYVPTMLRRLEQVLANMPSGFGLRGVSTGVRDDPDQPWSLRQTREVLRDRYARFLTDGHAGEEHVLPEKTGSSIESRVPFLFCQERPSRGLMRLWRRSVSHTLCVRDCPGEDFMGEGERVEHLHGGYLSCSAGILLCVAPHDLMDADPACMGVVDNLIQCVPKAHRERVALTVLLTKFDEHADEEPVIQDYLAAGSPFSIDAPQQWRMVDGAARAWVARVAKNHPVAMLDRAFADVMWLPVSALGTAPCDRVKRDLLSRKWFGVLEEDENRIAVHAWGEGEGGAEALVDAVPDILRCKGCVPVSALADVGPLNVAAGLGSDAWVGVFAPRVLEGAWQDASRHVGDVPLTRVGGLATVERNRRQVMEQQVIVHESRRVLDPMFRTYRSLGWM